METKWCVVVGSFCVLRSGVFGALLFSDFFYSVAASREKRFVIFFLGARPEPGGSTLRVASFPLGRTTPPPTPTPTRRAPRAWARALGRRLPPVPVVPPRQFFLVFPRAGDGMRGKTRGSGRVGGRHRAGCGVMLVG
jgi:hypothetical protein